MNFVDRADAGRQLSRQLRHLADERPVVLGLPRGGVPVAFEIARELAAPLDVLVVRKLGVPSHPELGFGAVGEDGVRVVRDDVVGMAGLDQDKLTEVEHEERAALARQARRLRGDRARTGIGGRTAILVDDGIATGATAQAACRVARAQGAARIVLAVPVAPPDAAHALREAADEVVCLLTPEQFFAVGEWYASFPQTSDAEVVDLLSRSPVTSD